MAARHLTDEQRGRVGDAIGLITRVPGFGEVAGELGRLLEAGRVRFDAEMEDRGVAQWWGQLDLGREALYAPPLGLAETLVHEHHHLRRQFPLEKTASFWGGVFTGTPVMRRFERPAYAAAAGFLRAVAESLPELAQDALSEEAAVRDSYAAVYGESLPP